MSGVFFNGRLWITPAVMSVVDDSRMFNKNLTVGNVLAVLGTSEGGIPNTAMRFGSPYEAIAALRSGPLLDAILRAFDPSSEVAGPSTIVAIRVNPAVQASLALKDAAAATVIDLVSTDYGLYTNSIKVKVESGSVTGKKLTTQFGNGYYSQDNIYRNAFEIQYAGAEVTATMTVAGASVTLAAPAGTTVATIDLTAYDTVQKLVDRINAVADFNATVLDGNGERVALQGLDFVTAQDVKTAAYTATAHLQACVDWINGAAEGYVTATRPANVGTVPASIDWTYLAGGSDGTTTNTEWSNGYATLQSEDVQWVVPASNSAAIHAMNDTHIAYMSAVARMERRGFVGMASGSTDAQALAAAKALNSDRTALVHLGGYDYDAGGRLKLYEPYVVAAMVAGGFAGSNPGTTMTHKSLKLRGLERKLRNPTDTDELIKGGVLCVEDTPTGFRVVKAISTWLNNENYNRVEVSTGAAIDFVARNVRQVLEDMIGSKGNPGTLTLAIEKTKSILAELSREEPAGPGVLVGDKDNPPFRNITAEIDGDVMRVEFECSPVIPINYIPITIHAVPWKGKVTA